MTISNKRLNLCEYRTSGVAVKRNKQRGVVLIVALIFLIALTAVASALMLNTTTDMKMSGASEIKVVATQEAFGAMDEVFFRQVRPAVGSSNDFILPIVVYQNGARRNVKADLVNANMHGDITSASIGVENNQYNLEVICPPVSSDEASSSGVAFCNILQVQINKRYGRNNTSVVQINAGVVQMLSNNQN